MKTAITLLFLLIISKPIHAQDSLFTVYNPETDALKQLSEAVSKANSEGKHVLVQVGGNWCKWCRLFYKWSHENNTIDSLLNADYIVIHVNYSKENKNPELMKRLDYPQRFGFPVFVIVEGKGNRMHTQNTGYLEDGDGYSEKKVAEFLKQWNAESVKDSNYQ